MARRTQFLTPWTPPPFQPFPPGQRSRPAVQARPSVGTGPAEAGAPGVIGNVFLTIDPLNGQALVGQRVTITGYRVGGNAPLTIAWSGPPGSSAPLTSTDRSISWIVQEGDSGTYTATATSPGAADSPQSAGIALTVGVPPPTTTIGMVTITGIIVPPEPPAFDLDAAAYIAAVEAADGQALETGVKEAINALVVTLKDTTGWAAMTNLLPLAGPRTLAGAQIPLKGTVDAFNNITSGDYDRKKGINGNRINKAVLMPLSPNRDDVHVSAYLDSYDAVDNFSAAFGRDNGDGVSNFGLINIGMTPDDHIYAYAHDSGTDVNVARPIFPSFIGVASDGPNTTDGEFWASTVTQLSPSGSLTNSAIGTPVGFHCRPIGGTLSGFTAGYQCFMSSGAYYNEPMQVKAAIDTYLAALATAIP